MADAPKSSPENIPVDNKKSMTFGDLYNKIQSESILTPEQEVAIRKKAVDKYGMVGLLSKQKEAVGENTRHELEELLADLPGKTDILAKLDTILPGKDKVISVATEGIQDVKNIGQKGIDAAKKLTPEGMTVAISETTDKLKEGMGKGGKEVLGAVGAIVSADSIEGASGGITKLSKAIDAVSSTFSSAMKGFGDMLSSFMAMLGLDKLWNSIKGLFGGSIEEKKEGDEKMEESVNNPEKITKLSEIEHDELYNASWRELCKMNTKYSKVVDINKKEEFKKLLDEYIAKSGISDKKSILDKFRTGFAGDFSFFKVFSLSRNLPASTTVSEVDSQRGHLNTFYNSLKESKIIVPELFQEEIKKDILLRMKDYGWISESQMDAKRIEIEKKFADPKYAELLAKAENAFITQKEEVSVGAFCIKMLLETPGIIFDFLGSVIPWSAVTVNAVDGVFYFGVRTYTALTTRGFNDGMAILTGVTVDELGKLSPEKRLLAITMLHQQGHLAFALAGMAAKTMSALALMPLYWTQGTGVTSMSMQKEQLFGEYDKMAGSMNHLTKEILTQAEQTQLFKLDGALRTQMMEAEAKLHLVDIWKTSPEKTQQQIHQMLSERMQHTGENLRIRDGVIDALVNKQEKTVFTQGELAKRFAITGSHNRWNDFFAQAKGGFVVEQAKHAELALSRSRDTVNAICNDAILQEGKIGPFMKRFASIQGKDIAEVVNDIKRGQIIVNLNTKTPEAQLKVLKDVMREMPTGMQHLFSGLSLVLVGGMVWEEKDDKMKVALQGLLSMHPFAATYILFTEGTTMKDHQWSNPQYLASMGIAGVFAGVEAVSVLMSARKIGWIPALVQSASAPYRVLSAIPRGIVNTGRIISAVKGGGLKAAGAHSAEIAAGAMKTAKGGRKAALIFGGIAVAVGLPSVAFAYFDAEKMKTYTEELERKSLISKNGGINWDGITEEAKDWSIEKKEQTLKFAAMQYLGENAQDVKIKDKAVSILIKPSTDPGQHMKFGIIDSVEIGNLRTLYTKLGYTTKIEYNQDADIVIKKQKEELSKDLTSEQLAQLEKQIEWVQPS